MFGAQKVRLLKSVNNNQFKFAYNYVMEFKMYKMIFLFFICTHGTSDRYIHCSCLVKGKKNYVCECNFCHIDVLPRPSVDVTSPISFHNVLRFL